jgi:hypothetical protein
MPVLKKIDNQHFIYEEVELNILVAIAVEHKTLIKDFWKKFKGKSVIGDDQIEGFQMIKTEEQDSLKIDFSTPTLYSIKNLSKFD